MPELFANVGRPIRSKEFFQSLDMLSAANKKMFLEIVEKSEKEKAEKSKKPKIFSGNINKNSDEIHGG